MVVRKERVDFVYPRRVSCFVVLIQQVRKFSFTWEMATWLTLRCWPDVKRLLKNCRSLDEQIVYVLELLVRQSRTLG